MPERIYIGVVASLTVGAIQQVRLAADRTQCQNNLRQIGLALHQFHDAYKHFPAAMSNGQPHKPAGSTGAPPQLPWLSWRGYLLPYIGQEPLWQITQEAYAQQKNPFWNPPHVGLATPIPTYLCPSDGRDPVTTKEASPKGPPYTTAALSSYLAVNGTDLKARDGAFLADARIKMADITDGTSNALAVGERPWPVPRKFAWWYAGLGQFMPKTLGTPAQNFQQQYVPAGTYTGSLSQTLGAAEINIQASGYPQFDGCPVGPYTFGPGTFENPCDAFHFWSPHPAGGNFLFADTSVRFLSYGIGANLIKLATIAGAEGPVEY
jgi:prepilin-type processing-associated H-X9-DG protein